MRCTNHWRAIAFGLVVVSVIAGPAGAQVTPMSGVYTVESQVGTNPPPLPPRTFPTLGTCVAALVLNGVSGPVTIDIVQHSLGEHTTPTAWRPLVSAGSGAFGGNAILVLDQFPGVSATNRVTFRTALQSPIKPVVFDCAPASAGVGVFFQGADYVTIENIEIKNAVHDGVMLYGEGGMFPTTPANATSDYCWIRRCRIHDCGGTGITLYGNSQQPGFIRIENNYFWNNMKNCVAPLHNFGRFGHISGRRNHDVTILHNSFYQDVPMVTASGGLPPCMVGSNNTSGTSFAMVSGNAFHIAGSGVTVPTGFYRWYTQGSITNIPSTGTGFGTGMQLGHDRNCYFNSSTGTVFGVVGSTTVPTLAAYRVATSLDANSIAADPQFRTPASGELDLASIQSPCVDVGVSNAGLTDDILGFARRGAAPDIGAMEALPPVLTARFTHGALIGSCPATCNFYDQSTTGGGAPITSWQWSFEGDGLTQSTQQNPTWTFSHPGVYSVSLIVSDGVQTSVAVDHHEINVTDSTPPVFSGTPTNVTVAATEPNCGAYASWIPPVAADVCSTVTVTSSHQPGQLFPPGTTTVTYTATDSANNVATATFDVIVQSVMPAITAQPSSVTVCAGASSTLTVGLSAAGPPPSFEWRHDGVVIPGATLPSYTIGSASSADVGNYTVVVANGCGTVTSNVAHVSVIPAPVITAQPQGGQYCTGMNITLHVAATGSGTLTYQWKFNNIYIPGFNTPNLPLPGITTAYSGTFTVTVTDSCGSTVSAPVVVQVVDPPIIVLAPAPITTYTGVPAIFQVSATSAIALTYQWRFNGNPIAGEIGPALTIDRVRPSDAGIYDVVVSTGCGSQTSPPAALTVQAFVLAFDQAAGSGSLHIHHTGGAPGASYFMAVSFHPNNGLQPGGGPWYGLWIDATLLADEYYTAAVPFFGTLDAAGDSDFWLPPGTISSNVFGITLWGVTVMGDAATATPWGASNVATLTIH